MFKLKRKGQSTIEYSVVIILVIGALLAMQQYIKRGLQGRWKEVVDDNLGDQYDPRFANSTVRHTLSTNTQTEIVTVNTVDGFWTTRIDVSNSLDTTVGEINVGAF